ncbi:lipase family protein [Yinghuangia soli]|uniref:Lipase family protein n=1 Tax=Yinghuangia soli TaxID=2908204 RepID=A0AA41Q0Y3_9ACTN|nr:lipase family protein [Yinghuangia soli]MCF2529534.1 lipase family protein [Yinghuangia soli]
MRRVAVLAAVGILAAAGCSRSGDDRRPERYGQVAASAAPAPAATPTTGAPSPSAGVSSSTSPAPSGSSSSAPPSGDVPAGEAFFDAPTPLPGANPGDVVRQRPVEANSEAIQGAGKELLVMYRTTGPDGQPVAATGTVALPNGPAPEGGWPVIAWDHGTTGIGAKCAPSRGFGPYRQGAGEMLAEFVKRGYAVVQPDYVGMGVNGVKHPYLNGKSAAYATFDLVRAARSIDPGVGKTWYVAGHSQGGHAALWSATYAAEYASELDLKGAVAVAPGNAFQLMPGLVAKRDATAEPYIGIFLLLVNGASAVDPSVKPEDILAPAGLTAAEAAWTGCAGEQEAALPPIADILKADADLGPITAVLEASAPEKAKPAVPVFMLQGGQDPLAALNLPMAQSLCAGGAQIEYRPYPELAHDPTEVSVAGLDIVAWVEARQAGTAPENVCTFAS